MFPMLYGIVSQGGASSLLTGLIAYYKCDEASGNLLDSLGNHNGTDVNTVGATTGKVGGARAYTSANSEYFNVAAHADLRANVGDFSYDGWIYVTSNSTTQTVLFQGTGTSDATLSHWLYVASLRLNWRVGNGTSVFTAFQTLFANAWTYFYVYYNATTKELGISLNHAASTTATLTGTINGPSVPLYIGSRLGSGVYLNGNTDELGRWNRLLTVDERGSRYNGGSGNTYPFDGGGSSPLPLYSGSFTYSSAID